MSPKPSESLRRLAKRAFIKYSLGRILQAEHFAADRRVDRPAALSETGEQIRESGVFLHPE
jgi:hypothetical protein